jgi:Kelch motif
MGCTSSKSVVLVTYESNTKALSQKMTSYLTIRSWISDQFPELNQQPYRIQTYKNPTTTIKNTQDYINLLKRSSGELHLEAVVEKPKRFKPEVFQDMYSSIFKVRKGQEDIEATGFMLSPRLCLLGINKGLYDHHALFEDGTSLSFKQEGVMIVLGDFLLAELEITPEWVLNTLKNKPLVLENDAKQPQALVLYYSKTKPVLQEYQGEFELDSECILMDPKSLRYCTPGAPVFNNFGKVFGIYLSKGKAVLVKKIIKNIETGFENLDQSFQEAFDEAFTLSNIKIPKNLMQTWNNLSAYIDPSSLSLVLDQDDELFYKNDPIESCNSGYKPLVLSQILSIFIQNYNGLQAQEGSSIVLTPYGIFITGCNQLGSSKKAWLFNQNAIIAIEDMNKKHINHSSIYLQQKVFVVSGKYTRTVETYDFNSKSWTNHSKLPNKRSYTSLLVYKSTLYLFGGVSSRLKIYNSILKLDEDTWTVCNFFLNKNLLGPGVILIEDDKVIVFGGMTNDDQYNNDAWIYSMDTGESNYYQEFDVDMVFGSYPTSLIDKDIVIYSNKGEKVNYSCNLNKLLI